MNFFKKGVEYKKLATAFNGLYLMLLDFGENSENEYSHEDLFALAYIGRREVIDRLENYNWNIGNAIMVPSISRRKISLAYAIQQTITKIVELSEELLLYAEIKEILDKKDLYYEIENRMPTYIKNIAFK